MVRAWAESLGGVVASEETIASSIGSKILSSGGNAVDAAVATSLALAVLIPHLGGVGGDFFMLYRTPEGNVFFVNGSGFAPRRLTRDEVLGRGLKDIPESGPLSSTTPGYLAGLYHSWRSFGTMEWTDLVRPARLLASKGFPLPSSTARSLKLRRECLESDPGSREAVLNALPHQEGAPARLPGLSALLTGVEDDPLYLYRGEPAEALEEYMASVGGVIGVEDLAETRGFIADPLISEYRGWKIWEMPPNTQGVTTLHLLMLLEDIELAEPISPQRINVLANLARRVYSIRDKYVGDPRYMPIDPQSLARKETLLRLLGGEEASPARSAGDTTFFAVADGEGGIVAGIQSLFYPWGSCVTEPRFQITLNNRARGFTLKEGLPSTLRPRALPLHTLSAVIMEREDRAFALGAAVAT